VAESVDAVDKEASEGSKKKPSRKKIKSPPREQSLENKLDELLEKPLTGQSAAKPPEWGKFRGHLGSRRRSLITGSSGRGKPIVKKRPAPTRWDDDMIRESVKIHRLQGCASSSLAAGTLSPTSKIRPPVDGEIRRNDTVYTLPPPRPWPLVCPVGEGWRMVFLDAHDNNETLLKLFSGCLRIFWNQWELADRIENNALVERDLFTIRNVIQHDIACHHKEFKFYPPAKILKLASRRTLT
jgi:hypothetical protein